MVHAKVKVEWSVLCLTVLRSVVANTLTRRTDRSIGTRSWSESDNRIQGGSRYITSVAEHPEGLP